MARTIGTYRSAISTMHEESEYRLRPNPVDDPHVARLIKGYARTNAAAENAVRETRPETIVITPTLLTTHAAYFTLGHTPQDAMTWAAVCLGAFSGIRINELLGSAQHPERRITTDRIIFYQPGPGKRVATIHVSLPAPETPSYFTLDLGATKADASGRKGLRTIAAPLAVAAMWKWMNMLDSSRARSPSLLLSADYDLTLPRLVCWLQDCFETMGQGRPNITGKVFRRGLASELESSTLPRAAAAEFVGWSTSSMLGVYSSKEAKAARDLAISRSLGQQ